MGLCVSIVRSQISERVLLGSTLGMIFTLSAGPMKMVDVPDCFT